MKRAKRNSGGKYHQRWWMFHCYRLTGSALTRCIIYVCIYEYIPYLIILLMEEILHHLGCIQTVNDGINYLSTGAGFQPSTVWPPFAQKAKNLLLVKECWINKSTHLSNGFNQKRTGCSPFPKKEVIIVPTQKYVFSRWSLFFQLFPWKCSGPHPPFNLKHKSTTALILPENNWDLPARRARLKEQSCE